MGIFSKLFGSSSELEKRLAGVYVPVFQKQMGVSAGEAKRKVKGILKIARQDSQKHGTWDLPLNCGDVFLEREKTHGKVKASMRLKRKEGVKDADIRWWWNMHDLERMVVMKIDEGYQRQMFIECKGYEGLNSEDTSVRVRKFFPVYGGAEEASDLAGEDRYLPHELKNRIDAYIEKMKENGTEEFKKVMEEAASFNALVRKEIKMGNI